MISRRSFLKSVSLSMAVATHAQPEGRRGASC